MIRSYKFIICLILLSLKPFFSFLAIHKCRIQRSDLIERCGVGKDTGTQNPEVESGIEWGQSFIGQDVCGSKYNDDPFGEHGDKPNAWEEMKKRIAAATARLQAEEEAKKQEQIQENKSTT